MKKLPPRNDVPAPFSTNLSFPLSFLVFFKTQTLGKVTQQGRDRIELSFFFGFQGKNAKHCLSGRRIKYGQVFWQESHKGEWKARMRRGKRKGGRAGGQMDGFVFYKSWMGKRHTDGFVF